MRLYLTAIVCFFTAIVEAQPAKPKATCEWIGIFIKSAINKFEDAKFSSTPTRQYEEDYDMGGFYLVEEFATRFLWPGTKQTYLQISTSYDETKQTLVLISSYEPVDTKEKAYAQLKKLYTELTPCTVTPLPGQKAELKGTLPSLAKAMSSTDIMNSVFTIPGGKRRVTLSLGIKEKDNKYFAEMQVSIKLLDAEVVINRCNDLQQAIDRLPGGFSGQLGRLNYSNDLDMGSGVVSETRTYHAKNGFPGSTMTYLENSKLKKNGKLKYDSWSMQALYYAYSYESALARYKKLHSQLQSCNIKSPAGRSISLDARYEDPKGDYGGIDFKTSTGSESFFVSLSFDKQDGRYIIWLKTSLAKEY